MFRKFKARFWHWYVWRFYAVRPSKKQIERNKHLW
jgi:hypothetical protein